MLERWAQLVRNFKMTEMKRITLIYFSVVFISSTISTTSYSQIQQNNRLDSLLIGSWQEPKNHYTSLEFDSIENYVTIKTNGDSLFRFKYTLNKDTLVLSSGNRIFKNKIKILSEEHLFFANFLDLNIQQSYIKMKRIRKPQY